MLEYPRMTQKQWDHLPHVFQQIIEWDEKDPRKLHTVIPIQFHDQYLEEVKDWKFNRNNLSEGARRFINKQRGGATA